MLFQAVDRREERGAAFTEYVVLLGVIVAMIALVGFTGLGGKLADKVTSIGNGLTPSSSATP
jgi:Flp pilus assembly pilin Flp